jgi:hypothetical protein
MRAALLLIALGVVTSGIPGRSFSQTQYGPCSLRIAIARDGSFFDILHNGTYKRSPHTLERELHGGCYNDSNPSPVTSVVLEIADGAPRDRTEFLYKLLDRNGWGREKIKVEPWSDLRPR